MSKKVFNMQGGKHSAAAYSELEKWAYGSVVASATSFVVSAGTGMNLNISTGAGLITDTIARRIGTDATGTAAVPTASASFNRIDTLVAYIDTAVTPTTSVTDNTNDILKFAVIAGTAASTPVAPTGAAIIAAIGAGKPYMVLYNVLVPQNATNTSGMTLTDLRVVMTSIQASQLPSNIITTAKIADANVTTAKIADANVTSAKLVEGFLRARRKNNTTDVNETGLRMQYGWGFCTCPGGGTFSNLKTVVFPVAFTAPPLVMATGAGYIDGADPVVSTDLATWEKSSAASGSVTTSQFVVRCYGGGDVLAATRRMGFTWLAIGAA